MAPSLVAQLARDLLAHELGGAGLVDLIRERSHTCYLGERGAQHALVLAFGVGDTRQFALRGALGPLCLYRGNGAL